MSNAKLKPIYQQVIVTTEVSSGIGLATAILVASEAPAKMARKQLCEKTPKSRRVNHTSEFVGGTFVGGTGNIYGRSAMIM